jgi:organic radical activating enzyme
MSKARISEIFHSIQGEGKYTGVRQVFVRFFECNIHCVWCDTPRAIGDTTRHYQEYGLEEMLAQIRNLWRDAHSVSLTGGEPLLQTDFLKGLLPRLKREARTVYLETSGILPRQLSEVIDAVDIVAMDFKLPSSTRLPAYWREHEAFLKIAKDKDTFIKTVISSDTTREDVITAARLAAGISPEILFVLQPNYFDRKDGAVEKCVDYQKECLKYLPNAKVMAQMHKEWKVR